MAIDFDDFDDFLANIEKTSQKLNENTLIVEAKKTLTDGLKNSELSIEEQELLISTYTQNISLGLVSQAYTIVEKFSMLNADIELKAAQKLLVDEQKKTEVQQTQNVIAEKDLKLSQKAKNTADVALLNQQKGLVILQQQEKKASAYKQLGVILTSNGWTNSNNGLVDEQILGFVRDMNYKSLKSMTEFSSMLAQGGFSTPNWILQVIDKNINNMIGFNPNVPAGDLEIN